MKTLKRQSDKTIKHLLANFNGVEVYLTVPSADAKEQKYYIEYKTDKRYKHYGKGVVKQKTLEFYERTKLLNYNKAMHDYMLADVFKAELASIKYDLTPHESSVEIGMQTTVVTALKSFYQFKELQQREGTVSKMSMYGYKHHQRKLELYFSLNDFKQITLQTLQSSTWSNYRVDLLSNKFDFGKRPLKNSSVNQHFLYVAQFYSWMINYLELPIKNHLNRLSKLNEAQQGKRFKTISDALLSDFYHILETHEKYYFTRLYLSALFLYENNVRLSEQVLIKSSDIDLEKSTIRVVNRKNDSVRIIAISDKVKELINIIKDNTLRNGIIITDEMFLIGGHNMFKSGIPHGQKELGVVMRRFRKKYPQFAGRTLYEHKHTSITKQFNTGVDTFKIKERANHSSISTTEIYLTCSKIVEPFTYKRGD